MQRKEIDHRQLILRPTSIWADQWLLLGVGDFAAGRINAMTVGWGSFGTMWSRPFVQVVVRPTRYSHEFMEEFDTFTLLGFPAEYRSDLQRLGTVSGRNHDKIAETHLTPCASQIVAAPSFEEAELAVECRKIYSDQMRSDKILDESIHRLYPESDYHTIYFGEILRIFATDQFVAQHEG